MAPTSQTITIQSKHKQFVVQTPSYLVHTNKGSVPNITPDLLKETLQLTAEHHILNINLFDLFVDIFPHYCVQ